MIQQPKKILQLLSFDQFTSILKYQSQLKKQLNCYNFKDFLKQKLMTHVLYFGVGEFALQMQTLTFENQKLQRIIFPQNKYSKDPNKTSRKGEQELCFINVQCCEQNTFLIDNQYNLWGFGSSQFSQLGLQQSSVVSPVNISQITQNLYKSVSGGTGYVVAYSTNKKLYVWGNWHQLNYGEVLKLSEKQGYSEQIDQQYQISCLDITYNFSILKNIENERRQSYLPNHQAEVLALKCVGTTTYLLTPNQLYCLGLQLQFQVQFVGIACGKKHILAWDDQGKVWSWGEFADGKLGYMDFILQDQKEPKQIENITSNIVSCACGLNYSIALDAKGDIYGWGKGPFKMDLSIAVTPTKLCQKQRPFIKIMAGDSHFGALDLQGQLFGWGINQKNCLGNLQDRTRYPQLFELKNIKVIDAAMGSTSTVLIVPINENYKIPNLNIDQYTSHQQKRIKEETAFMKDFADRKNRLDQIQFKSPTQNYCDTPISFKSSSNYEEAVFLLKRMKNQADSLKDNQRFKHSPSSLHFTTDIPNSQTQITYQDYDDVTARLKQLENENYLYIPLCQSTTPNTNQYIDQNDDHEDLLNYDNDMLKLQYILMVKSQDESKLLKNLLNDPKKHQQETLSQFFLKQRILKYKQNNRGLNDKKKFHDKYDTFDPYFLTNVKRDIKILNEQRKEIFCLKQKQREQINREISEKMQLSKLPLQSRDEIIKCIQNKAHEKDQRLKLVQLKKKENYVGKMNLIQQQILEKTPEFKYKKRLDTIKTKQNLQILNMILIYLNTENICQMIQETSQRGLELKRMMFKEHMKARIIQNTIRKRNVIKRIKQKLGLRQKKILLSFIFRFKINFRIKSKYGYLRKINLFHLKNQLIVKVAINLKTIIIKTETIQKFCKLYNNMFYVQLSYLNYKWDEYLKQCFKGNMPEKEREEIKQYELPNLIEKQNHIIKKLTAPLKLKNCFLNELKFKIKPVLKATELKTNLLKKVKTIVQIDEDLQDVDVKCSDRVLLPYTKYVENIALSVASKIRFDYQMMTQLDVHEKVFMEELNVKFEILKEQLERLRRDHFRQMRDFYAKLNEYKENHKQQINIDRGKAMIRFKVDGPEFKILKQKDDQDLKLILSKREMARKKYGQNTIIYKDVIFNKIRQLQQDQYPFPNLIIKLSENMYADNRPKFRLKLNQHEWTRLFNQYQQELKQRYTIIMNEARKNFSQKTKQIKSKKVVQRTRVLKTES
ncbi:unnamed protein product [Paramecium pentaurelia]|uniref:Regulator of chromosome condensation 1/beta-lactamase-inhibitor protein II n=1 Tax=Paramecium pentaurelia TaxID=43138 RepID=A0A8S1TCS6_9CILI|nr:unnamed protein product [Paramecium pentaurelia]